MSDQLRLRVYEKQQLHYDGQLSGAVEVGRQSEGEEPPFAVVRNGGKCRLVVARLEEDTVSRRHALLEPLPRGMLRLTNLSTKMPIRMPGGQELWPGKTCDVSLPVLMSLGPKTLRVEGNEVGDVRVERLHESMRPPGDKTFASTHLATLALTAGIGMDVESLVRWLQVTMTVLHSAAGSSDFLQQAAKAVVELVGLDSGRVVIWEGDGWKSEAVYTAPHITPENDWQPSQFILSKVRLEKTTIWLMPGAGPEVSPSLIGLKAVVAAPILNPQGEVIGALYGDRRQGGASAAMPQVSKLEAMLVELVASGVAAGLARIEQEEAALAARVQFEQFFTHELALQLAAHPDLLKGRDSEITILFCDIRGFSRVSERLGPAGTVEWVSDVMEALSDCVLVHQGVVVDYIGDELMAMWGAPQAQDDHARLACRAALAMLAKLYELDARWQSRVREPLLLGIGVNSGIARVGNIGTQRKFKYGPLGNAVNLASRIQGATKYLKTPLLVSGSTQAHLDRSFHTRRIRKVEVVNIAEPVDLYEVVPPGLPRWPELRQQYEQALTAFEGQDYRKTMGILSKLQNEYPDDGPSLVLLARVTQLLHEEVTEPSAVWKLPGK